MCASVTGVVVTFERGLPGVSVRAGSAFEQYGCELPAEHVNAVLTVMRGLASVPGTEALRRLVVQGMIGRSGRGMSGFRMLWRRSNIYADETGEVVAVLDFKFFATAGDPAFEGG